MLKLLNDFKLCWFLVVEMDVWELFNWCNEVCFVLLLVKNLFEVVGNLNIVELLDSVLYKWFIGIGVRI